MMIFLACYLVIGIGIACYDWWDSSRMNKERGFTDLPVEVTVLRILNFCLVVQFWPLAIYLIFVLKMKDQNS